MPLGATRFGFLGAPDPGQLQLIETKSYSSSVSTIDFTNLGSGFNVHFVTFNDISNNGNPNTASLRFFESGTLETDSVYQYARQVIGFDGTRVEQNSTSNDKIPIFGSFKNATNYKQNAYMYLYNALDSNKFTFCTIHDVGLDYYSDNLSNFSSNHLPQKSTVDGFRLFGTLGFNSYNISLYGVKNS